MRIKYVHEPQKKNDYSFNTRYNFLKLEEEYYVFGILVSKSNTLYVVLVDDSILFVEAKYFSIIDPTLFSPAFFGKHISQNDVYTVFGSEAMATNYDYLARLYGKEKTAVEEFKEYTKLCKESSILIH
ncbi:MAG: hypothetical protein AB7U79_04255 [Candidatus Izemoplasmatales bacterium]